MSISIRIVALLTLLLASFMSYAQDKSYQYQMDGVYPANLPGLSAPQRIKFTLQWNEKDQFINGVYSDSFFTSSSPVSGTTGVLGRVFSIRLPRILQNVSQLSLTSANGTVMVFMKDVTEMTVDQANIQAKVVTKIDYVPGPETTCEDCGLYMGTINEVGDSKNQCNLPEYGFAMEITKDSRAKFYFYYSESTLGVPDHELGPYPFAPKQHCGMLVGTSFPPDGCQTLSVKGTFAGSGKEKSFRGKYTITDEKDQENCVYDLVLERKQTL
jgi:hypothetical protein